MPCLTMPYIGAGVKNDCWTWNIPVMGQTAGPAEPANFEGLRVVAMMAFHVPVPAFLAGPTVELAPLFINPGVRPARGPDPGLGR